MTVTDIDTAIADINSEIAQHLDVLLSPAATPNGYPSSVRGIIWLLFLLVCPFNPVLRMTECAIGSDGEKKMNWPNTVYSISQIFLVFF